MDLITIYKINNIMSMDPQFHLVDTPYNDLLITNFEEMIGSTKLFWKLKCASPKNLINIRKQHKIHEIIDLVNQLNVGIMELIKIDGCGKYAWFEYSEQFNVNLSNYAKGVGEMYACQLSLKLYIEDATNEVVRRKYAERIYEWLGTLECSIDDLCQLSVSKTNFILYVLQKYNPIVLSLEVAVNYSYAIDSLKSQINMMQTLMS